MLLKKVRFFDERKRSFAIIFFDAKFASETDLSFLSSFNVLFATTQRSLARS